MCSLCAAVERCAMSHVHLKRRLRYCLSRWATWCWSEDTFVDTHIIKLDCQPCKSFVVVFTRNLIIVGYANAARAEAWLVHTRHEGAGGWGIPDICPCWKRVLGSRLHHEEILSISISKMFPMYRMDRAISVIQAWHLQRYYGSAVHLSRNLGNKMRCAKGYPVLFADCSHA